MPAHFHPYKLATSSFFFSLSQPFALSPAGSRNPSVDRLKKSRLEAKDWIDDSIYPDTESNSSSIQVPFDAHGPLTPPSSHTAHGPLQQGILSKAQKLLERVYHMPWIKTRFNLLFSPLNNNDKKKSGHLINFFKTGIFKIYICLEKNKLA